MRLRNLFESTVKEVAIIFGRFNPPHQGHKAAWETAATKDVWYVGTNESTVGPKDPLPFNVKVEAMKTIWPGVQGHIIGETSWLTLASRVFEKHGKVRLICVTDESWVVPTVQEYNGKKGPHGFYDFPEIRLYHDSIEEAKLALRKSSATSLRDAVAKGDRRAFSDAAGVSAETPVMGKPFFDLVAEYLMPYQEKAKAKADKAKAKAEKPKKETKPKKEKELAEGIFDIFKKLPAPGSTVKIAGRPVEITHAGVGSDYIGFAWTDKNGKEHYEETPAEEHNNLRSLAKTIAAEIKYADDDGVDDELDAQIKGRLDRHFGKNKDMAEGSDDKYQERRKGKSPKDLGASDAWYHRGNIPSFYGFEKGTQEYEEYVKAYDEWDEGPSGGKQWDESSIEEISDKTKASYKEKATAKVKELEPHAKKGEYKDIAQNIIDRLQRGLSRVKENKKQKQDSPKPRNFVAKNAMSTTSGAGAHTDKKKAAKQGYEKHKGKIEISEDKDHG